MNLSESPKSAILEGDSANSVQFQLLEGTPNMLIQLGIEGF